MLAADQVVICVHGFCYIINFNLFQFTFSLSLFSTTHRPEKTKLNKYFAKLLSEAQNLSLGTLKVVS